MKDDVPTAQGRLSAAVQAMKAGNQRLARTLLTEILATQPDCAEASELLGIAYANTQNWEYAIKAFRDAIRCAPRRASAHYNMALVLAQRGDYEDALDELRTTLMLEPQHLVAKGLQAECVQRVKDRLMHTDPDPRIGDATAVVKVPSAKWSRLPCPTCNAMNFPTARFCVRCGSSLEQP